MVRFSKTSSLSVMGFLKQKVLTKRWSAKLKLQYLLFFCTYVFAFFVIFREISISYFHVTLFYVPNGTWHFLFPQTEFDYDCLHLCHNTCDYVNCYSLSQHLFKQVRQIRLFVNLYLGIVINVVWLFQWCQCIHSSVVYICECRNCCGK